MTLRSSELQAFLSTLAAALGERVLPDGQEARAAGRIFGALGTIAGPSGAAPTSFPVVDHLPAALEAAAEAPSAVARHAAALEALAPQLIWRRRPNAEDDPKFTAGHANSTIVGPGGIEDRSDVWVGISLLAPGVVYPDHRHPPEEIYLVMSEGDWRQNDGQWHTPGQGGIVYNPPGIVHAMRAGPRAPLLATWCLWAG
jgi:quercetin dioxygenase-like cupin family protein